MYSILRLQKHTNAIKDFKKQKAKNILLNVSILQ